MQQATDPGQQSAWDTSSQGQFTTADGHTFSLHSLTSEGQSFHTTQGTIQAFGTSHLTSAQFQQLGAGAFQQVYQSTQPTYGRVSSIEEFTQRGATSGDSLHNLPPGTQLITVPLLMGGTGQVTDQIGSTSLTSGSTLTGGQLEVEDTVARSLAMGLPVSVGISQVTSQASLQGTGGQHTVNHIQEATDEQSMHHLEESNRQHTLLQAADASEMFHVMTPMVSLSDNDTSTSQGVGMMTQAAMVADQTMTSITLPLQDEMAHSHKVLDQSFSGESTQTTDSTYPQVVQEQPEGFNTSAAADLGHDQLTASQMEPSSMHAGMHRSSFMLIDSSMDSGVPQQSLDIPGQDPGMDNDPMHDSGETGGEADLAQMLAQAQASGIQMPTLTSQEGVHDKENREPYAQVRKSERIAHMERSPSPIARPKYVPKKYSTDELWCDDCQTTYSTSCPVHRIQAIYDRVVLSRAWSSLPAQLQIFRLGASNELGVFSKRSIPKRTQFGPFLAEIVDSKEKLTNPRFLVQVDRENGPGFLEATDENKCNWMMFIRPAETFLELNLVAYQFGQDIYYATVKNIEPKTELKVWYAAHYAEKMGFPVLEPTDADMEAMDEADLRWPCYECNRKFRTHAQLHNHLAIHEETGSAATEKEENGEEKPARRRRRGFGVRGARGHRLMSNSKKIREIIAAGTEEGKFQSWKKQKTNLYFNKLMKSKYSRNMKSPMKTIYKKSRSGVNEWVCIHCDLTFDNASLLNLHTLTHAAEDVGLDEITKLTAVDENGEQVATNGDIPVVDTFAGLMLSEANLECPVCHKQFSQKQELIEHASEHAKLRRRQLINPRKPYKCPQCWKSFSVEDSLQKHLLCHGAEETKPLKCEVCCKRFMNNSALACHMKTHSDKKYYECPICKEGFVQIHHLKLHTATHAVNGVYQCPECSKEFINFNVIRKHMRAFHSEKQYPCKHCDKVFPRPDKLKLHMLRHSDHREFMCESCGRQFKRKDKLKEHKKRMHNPEREARMLLCPKKSGKNKKFIPKVSPNDYHRFIYKCHACLLGFKRRGMLVNHLAKRHPDIKPESVPELNLPILRTQRDYYCQYCDKVYKSSSKRKSHILKNHPGAELPASARKKLEWEESHGLPNPTFSQTVGSVTTVPHPCTFCHKQYASKAKLLQHQRKKHTDFVPMAQQCRKTRPGTVMTAAGLGTLDTKQGRIIALLQQDKLEDPGQLVPITIQPSGDHAQDTDLLTQAMSELTQTLNEYRTQQPDFPITTGRLAQAADGATVMQTPHGTIELSHLGLAHFQPPGVLPQSPSPTAQSMAPAITIVTSTSAQAPTIPAPASQTAFVTKSWVPPSILTTFR